MKSSKHTLTMLATAAAVAFGGVAVAQSMGESGGTGGTAASTTLSQEANVNGNGQESSANNNDRGGLFGTGIGSDNQQANAEVDTRTMGNSAGANTTMDAQAANNTMRADGMRAPRMDRN